jgi:hypothetical protein
MLTMEHPDTGDSPAEIMADVINIMRADTKKLAELHVVDIDIRLITPERAAELLAGTIDGEGVELLVMFNELAEQRDNVVREALDGEVYECFEQERREIMHTGPETEGYSMARVVVLGRSGTGKSYYTGYLLEQTVPEFNLAVHDDIEDEEIGLSDRNHDQLYRTLRVDEELARHLNWKQVITGHRKL